MQNRFLCTLGLLLTTSLAHAQTPSATLPSAAIVPAAGTDLSSPGSVSTEGYRSCDPTCCQRPRWWVNTEYLLWWVRGGPLNTPLVTTGSLADIPPGALGQP